MIVFTSICANYGHKARVLAASVKKHIPDARFLVCLTEREIPAAFTKDHCFDRIVLAKDMWEGNFDRFIFKHDIVEASTAVKGAFFQWLMKEYPNEDAYVYLDPDCRVYSDFVELREMLRRKSAVLCPHLLHPGNIDMELSSTAHGVYNLGFLAVNGSGQARRLVDWWAERLYLYCYDDIANGIFTDQKWMDLAPCFFDVEIMHHYGYDYAPWGLQGTTIRKDKNAWMIQEMPLRFIHFSGFGPVAEMCMEKWLDDQNSLFREIYASYAAEHETMDGDRISATPWSYAHYRSGEKISRTVREAYRKNWDVMFAREDPFAESNLFFAEQLGLKELDDMPLKPAKTSLGKKWGTARRVLKRDGVGGVLSVIGDKMRRQGK